MENKLGQHAIVIGGSITGLMTARVLAQYFTDVTILERDSVDEHRLIRKSIPQANHYHALRLGGQHVLASLFPGFANKLLELGAISYRVGRDTSYFLPDGKAYSLSGSVKEPRDLGFDAYSQSRGLLESCIRQFVKQIPNIKLEVDSTAEGLVYSSPSVRSVRYRNADHIRFLEADLIVDAGGRGSSARRWLVDLGFQTPEETVIGVDFGYASTKLRIPDWYDEPERLMCFFGKAPHFPNGAYLGQIENNIWHLSLAGRFGDYPPSDEPGFYSFTKSLHTPKLYELIKDAERVADISHYRFPKSSRFHFERLTNFPEGFLVLGDAIASFNPVYGQGISSAALQVQALEKILLERRTLSYGLTGLPAEFFAKAAEVIDSPWTIAANLDFAYPKTKGERPSNLRESARYFSALNAIGAEDIDIQRLVSEVFHLSVPLSALTEEPLYSRVMAYQNDYAVA